METITATAVEPEASADLRPAGLQLPAPERMDPDDAAFEIGAWIESVLAFDPSLVLAFSGPERGNDLRREFRIVNGGLHRLVRICSDLIATVAQDDPRSQDAAAVWSVVRSAIATGEAIATAANVDNAQWSAWWRTLCSALRDSEAARRFSLAARRDGRDHLPPKLLEIMDSAPLSFADRYDLEAVLPRVGTTLRFLEVIGRMHRNDEPMKPTLLIFAAVHAQTRGLIQHINNRLARLPDDQAPLFNSLDCASYSVSLELKKVFRQELQGILPVLPPTSVYARIETAYSLLLDSCQQILVDLARLVEPSVSPFDLFPRYQIKLDQSLILRQHLWQILKSTREAEAQPDSERVRPLQQELKDFLSITIRFLHYKDEETFERFAEEVIAARDKKDLVPILHRFSAYLETLFGQVSMRGVLADYPFKEM